MKVGDCSNAEPPRRTNQLPGWRNPPSLQAETVIPAKAGIQYAAASRIDRCCLWNTGSPPARGCRRNVRLRSRGTLRPSFASSLPSSDSEGAGKTGCLLHPRSRVRFALTRLHTSIQVQRGIPAFPAQWLYGLLRALPGERLFCLRRPRETFASPALDASTATPGPHDFTVRVRRARLSRPQRPPHPTARS